MTDFDDPIPHLEIALACRQVQDILERGLTEVAVSVTPGRVAVSYRVPSDEKITITFTSQSADDKVCVEPGCVRHAVADPDAQGRCGEHDTDRMRASGHAKSCRRRSGEQFEPDPVQCARCERDADAQPDIRIQNILERGLPFISTYEVWVEGYAATGEHGYAQKIGTVDAPTFAAACEAVIKVAKAEGRDFGEFDPEKLTVWGCCLFDNETDARKSYG